MRYLLLLFFILSAPSYALEFDVLLKIERNNKPVAEFNVALAKTPAQQKKGLMNIVNLKENQGMYFIFPAPRVPKFWMKNTPLSLDIIFINENGIVTEIFANAEAMSEKIISPHEKVIAVLEIKSGISKHLGVKKGDKVRVKF